MNHPFNRWARPLTVGAGCGLLTLTASIAISPAIAGKSSPGGGAGTKSCNSTSPCLARQNTSSGAGVLGGSAGGNGIVGQTTFFNTRTGAAGVSGLDLATPNPNGTPLNNSGVNGQSASGFGVFGQTSSGIGVRGSADTGTALVGNANGGDGVFGTTQSNEAHISSAGVFGEDVGNSSAAYGVLGFSRTGIGVQGDNFEAGTNLNVAVLGLTFASSINTYFPARPAGGLFNSDSGEGLVAETSGAQAEALSAANFGGGPVMRGYAASTEVMELDNSGNLIITGKLTQHGNPGAITHTRDAGDVVVYAPREAAATVEDDGEAKLTQGQAYVRIDPRFRATMAGDAYLVFITPQGDTPGLYVSQKSQNGFAVREHGGQSNIAFDYRIVAAPLDSSAKRLAPAPRLLARGYLRTQSLHKSDFLEKRGEVRR